MKPTDLFTDLTDFQKYTDGLTPDTTYAQLSPSITTVVNTILLPMVTASVYVALAGAAAPEEGDTEEEKAAKETALEGKELLKTAVAAGAMLQYQIFASVKKNGSEASLYKYQHEEIKDHYREALWGAMDQLLELLDANPSIGDFKETNEYKERQQLPVKNAREFDRYYGIGASSFFYHKILFLIRQVWRSDVKSLLPANTTEEMAELAKEALCYKVVALAVMQFDVTELPRAIRWDNNHEFTKDSKPQERMALYSQLISHFGAVKTGIENLKRSAAGVGSVAMNNNSEDKKYYVTL